MIRKLSLHNIILLKAFEICEESNESLQILKGFSIVALITASYLNNICDVAFLSCKYVVNMRKMQ